MMNKIVKILDLLEVLSSRNGNQTCPVAIEGLDDLQVVLSLGWSVSREPDANAKVILLPTMKRIRSLKRKFEEVFNLTSVDSPFHLAVWPELDFWSTANFTNPRADVNLKVDCLNLIHSKKKLIIFTTYPSLLQRTLSYECFSEARFELKIGTEIDQPLLISKLEEIGFQRTKRVEEKGYYALRGGVIDIFSGGYCKPIRIELMGDEIVAIRTFSLENQRSISSISSVVIGPVIECIFPKEERTIAIQQLHEHLIGNKLEKYEREGALEAFRAGLHFPGLFKLTPIFRRQSSNVIEHLNTRFGDNIDFASFVEPLEVSKTVHEFFEMMENSYQEEKARNLLTLEPHQHFDKEFLDIFCKRFSTQITLVGLSQISSEVPNQSYKFVPPEQKFLSSVGSEIKSEIDLFDEIVDFSKKSRIVFVCETESRFEKLELFLNHRGLGFEKLPDLSDLSAIVESNASIIVVNGRLTTHQFYHHDQIHLIPTTIFWGEVDSHVSSEKRLKNYLKSFKNLKNGDLVVHVNHGVGRFLQLSKMSIGDRIFEFLTIMYAGGDKIHVPIDKVSMLQKFTPSTSGNSSTPLDRLVGKSWSKRKHKVKEAVEIMAEELLLIQAKRKISKAVSFGPQALEFKAFVDEFPYEETPDQEKVWQEIERDLCRGKIMDRLVVGDVGFGKTEIALRAAFRTVLEGGQVMVLAPTTILCHQHFETFRGRIEKFGANVRAVNRFIKVSQINQIADGWKSGSIDILIGTHKLLGKRFIPRNLMLIIVDEEQRFGVGHKEKIKELSSNASVLTMSATPIPRTLHMSMLGLRDISLLASPPRNRFAVRNFLIKFDKQLIKNAIEHEIRRGGQVFFVHDRIQDIMDVARVVQELCESAKVNVGHGRLSEVALEERVKSFLDKQFNVFVCTSIIESGVDMPNVNTIIINNAHHFGLSQLYQLRGRVGRSIMRAYAYFITPSLSSLSDEARKKLDVLMTHQELGSGFQVASHDMEIRGVGNLLGEKQSGHVASVGIELYTKMLDDAVRRVRGLKVEIDIEPEIKLSETAFIPEWFVEDQSQRLSLYKQIFSVSEENDINLFKRDMIDQYGELPTEFNTLLDVARIKLRLKALKVKSLTQVSKCIYELKFAALSERQICNLRDICTRKSNVYRLSLNFKLLIDLGKPTKTCGIRGLIERLGELSLL